MSNNNFENISLYIPRVFLNITQERIKSAFEKNGIGKVKRVDLLSKVPDYNIAYVHFDYWNDTITARNFQSHTKEQKGAKLVYDDPWHWIVLENKATRYEPGARKVRINLGEPRLDFKSALELDVDPIDELMSNLRKEEEEIEREREQREREKQQKKEKQQKYEYENEDKDEDLMEMLRQMEEIDEELKNEDVSLVEAQYVEMLEASNATMFNQVNMLQQENYQLNKKINDLQEEHNIGLKVLISEIQTLRQQIEYLKNK
jgi:vacuolar-type H+-ATPase subunit I/STV1